MLRSLVQRASTIGLTFALAWIGFDLAEHAQALTVDLKLADIVGGGDGISGGVAGSGIDPSTGGTLAPAFFEIIQPDNIDAYHSSSVNFVDGVFIPDGGAGALTLDSALHAFVGFPNTAGNSWDRIKYGPNQNSGTSLSGVNYNSGTHTMIGLHANKGITFDLQEIASARPGMYASSFTAVAGMSHIAGGYGTADWWVFVDGILQQSQLNVAGGVGTAMSISLDSSDQFLTLVSTDAGDGFSVDQIIFGDPLIHLSQIPEPSSAALVLLGTCYAVVRSRKSRGRVIAHYGSSSRHTNRSLPRT